jgi:hypothetical protein
MFCPNCGEKVDSHDQRFCASCGSEIGSNPIPEVSQVLAEENQVSTLASSIPVSESKQIKTGGPGVYSKKIFPLAFFSLVLAAIGFVLEFLAFLRFVIPFYVFPRLPGGPVLWIVALIFHIVGLLFAIRCRVNNKKAGQFETKNTIATVGSVFGVFGIIANAIPIAILSPITIIMIL